MTNSIMRQGAWAACALRQCGLIEWYTGAAGTGRTYPECEALRAELKGD